jgi:hypothetical protein
VKAAIISSIDYQELHDCAVPKDAVFLLLAAVETIAALVPLPHTKQSSNSTLQPVISRPSLGCSGCNGAQLSSVLSERVQHAGCCCCCFCTAAIAAAAADATAVAETAASTAAKAGNCCSDCPSYQQRLLHEHDRFKVKRD